MEEQEFLRESIKLPILASSPLKWWEYLLARDRIINLAVGSLTFLLLIVTLISAFVFPQLPPKPVNIFFAFCIFLCSVSVGILIYWYRQGDLEPKFRNLIYYILFSIVMLCICANLYFHEVGK
nr:transmembrane protein 243 isoform X1 [Pelodiscus sinensis]|eukprot:XP_014425971.1 transmembrane protein 243 isoform X1 [Pelodiscus sinensis]